jgi:hypothetical protein
MSALLLLLSLALVLSLIGNVCQSRRLQRAANLLDRFHLAYQCARVAPVDEDA